MDDDDLPPGALPRGRGRGRGRGGGGGEPVFGGGEPVFPASDTDAGLMKPPPAPAEMGGGGGGGGGEMMMGGMGRGRGGRGDGGGRGRGGGGRGGGEERADFRGPPGLFKAGDWTCPSCGNVNWERRDRCNMCQTSKPQLAGAGEVRDGIGGGFMERQARASATLANEISEDGYDDFGRKIVRF